MEVAGHNAPDGRLIPVVVVGLDEASHRVSSCVAAQACAWLGDLPATLGIVDRLGNDWRIRLGAGSRSWKEVSSTDAVAAAATACREVACVDARSAAAAVIPAGIWPELLDLILIADISSANAASGLAQKIDAIRTGAPGVSSVVLVALHHPPAASSSVPPSEETAAVQALVTSLRENHSPCDAIFVLCSCDQWGRPVTIDRLYDTASGAVLCHLAPPVSHVIREWARQGRATESRPLLCSMGFEQLTLDSEVAESTIAQTCLRRMAPVLLSAPPAAAVAGQITAAAGAADAIPDPTAVAASVQTAVAASGGSVRALRGSVEGIRDERSRRLQRASRAALLEQWPTAVKPVVPFAPEAARLRNLAKACDRPVWWFLRWFSTRSQKWRKSLAKELGAVAATLERPTAHESVRTGPYGAHEQELRETMARLMRFDALLDQVSKRAEDALGTCPAGNPTVSSHYLAETNRMLDAVAADAKGFTDVVLSFLGVLWDRCEGTEPPSIDAAATAAIARAVSSGGDAKSAGAMLLERFASEPGSLLDLSTPLAAGGVLAGAEPWCLLCGESGMTATLEHLARKRSLPADRLTAGRSAEGRLVCVQLLRSPGESA